MVRTLVLDVGNADPNVRQIMQPVEIPPIHEALVQQIDTFFEGVNGDEDIEITLILSCRTWTVPCLEALLPSHVLDRIVPYLTVLRVDDTTASLLTDKGFETLQWYNDAFMNAPKLRELYLDDLALGTRGVDRMRQLLSIETIRVLSLHNTGAAEADISNLASIFVRADGICYLTELYLGRNRTAVDGAFALENWLAACKFLERFEYIGCSPLKAGSRAMSRGLRRMVEETGNTVLHTLDIDLTLNDGQDEEDAVIDFAAMLALAVQIKHLNLTDAELKVEGLQRVLDALRLSGAQLEFLDISGSESGLEGAQLLTLFLSEEGRTANLSFLGLELNELEDDGIVALAEVLATNCPVLTELRLEENLIEAAGARALIDNPIPSLQKLSLRENSDLPLGAARRLCSMYPQVLFDEDLQDDGEDWGVEEEEEEAEEQRDEQVDALVDELANAQI